MSAQFLVSARKYRPQTFDTVVGQEHITTTLKNAIRHNQLAHAYLFCGPRGVGKTTCARILAKTLNCEQPTPDTEACGVCENCRAFDEQTSFNVFELDAASNNSVEDIRELVNQVRFAPQQGRFKVYIIDEVHMLSTSAFNAFLKTLEEPPPYAVFILATTEKHKILPTILSRCQIFDFRRIRTADTVAHLQRIAEREQMNAEESALHLVAQKSEGSMRDALSMLDRIASFTDGAITYSATMEHLSMLDATFYFSLTDALLSMDIAGVVMKLEEVLAKGFENDAVLSGLADHFRNLLLCKDERMTRLLEVPPHQRRLFLEKAHQVAPSYLMTGLGLLHTALLEYRNAVNKRIHTEVALIQLAALAQSLPLETEKKNPERTAFPPVDRQPTPIIVSPVLPASEPSIPVRTSGNVVEEPAIPELPQAPLQAYTPPPEKNGISRPPVPDTKPDVVGNDKNSGVLPARRRISKDFLAQVGSRTMAETAEKETVLLTPELAENLFREYQEQLLSNGESVLHAQFTQMKPVVLNETDIRFLCPTELSEVYLKNQRDRMGDFFQQRVGRLIRFFSEVVKDDSLPPPEKQRSKQEIYQDLARENPQLEVLRKALGLQIDY